MGFIMRMSNILIKECLLKLIWLALFIVLSPLAQAVNQVASGGDALADIEAEAKVQVQARLNAMPQEASAQVNDGEQSKHNLLIVTQMSAEAGSSAQSGVVAHTPDSIVKVMKARVLETANVQVSGIVATQGNSVMFDLYRRAAELGNADAQNSLAEMYLNGPGVAQNNNLALELFRKAAVQGNAAAKRNLGLMNEQGHGVAQSYMLAQQWYLKAAQQGDAKAYYLLGVMNELGHGVPQNYKKAAFRYYLAARGGDAQAEYHLGVLYAEGKGGKIDLEQAHKWFNLAALAGNESGRKAMIQLEIKMSPEQLLHARNQVQEWLNNYK